MVVINTVVIILKILANITVLRKYSNLEVTNLLTLIIVFTRHAMIEARLSKRQVKERTMKCRFIKMVLENQIRNVLIITWKLETIFRVP